ncbi:MAG: T9SS type A sorting domain-containing protein [Bacteroidetes bacterium]|nr:T9SS type A sorting domain-containing protein [Bacteroidota bacterium]MBL7104172.1 T9SS type A sorting domain-containing protein [Bacteroidales bacterium]
MKIIKLAIAFFFTLNFVNAQNSRIEWIKQEGGNSEEIGCSITSDDDYIYNTGVFADTCFIGDTVLISNGLSNMYISKYDKESNFIWVKQFGGNDYVRSMFITHNNAHIYTTGFFSDTAYFEDTTLISKGYYDLFITDQSTDGNLNWVKQIGGIESDQGYTIATDSYNNIYLSGAFQDTVNFGDTTLISYGDYDIFLAKLDNTGNVKWVQHSGGKGTDLGLSIISDNSDNICLTGYFEDTAVFNDTLLFSLGFQDIFIAKYNNSGNLVWIQQAGGDWGAYGSSITTDDSDNIYITGIFGGTAFFGNDTVVSNGEFDIYVAKYDSSGKLLLIKTYGSAGFDHCKSIVTDNDFIYVSCNFQDEALIEDTLLLEQTSHIFQFSNTGQLLDIIQTGNYYRNECIIDKRRDVYVTGAFYQTQIFGDTILTTTGFHYDIFIAKIIYNNTGIEKIEIDPKIKIYPNPATSYINIESDEDAIISIVNINGQLLKQYLFVKDKSEKTFDISSFAPGLYIIKIQTESKILSGKIIKY